MKTVEIKKANFFVTIPEYTDNTELLRAEYWVRPVKQITVGACPYEYLLTGKEGEQQYPERTLAGALLLRHPLVQNEGLNWGIREVEGIKQGVFVLTDRVSGEKYQYAVRAAQRENGETIVLWGWSSHYGATFGYYQTEATDGSDFDLRVKPDTFITRNESDSRLKKNPNLPKVIVENITNYPIVHVEDFEFDDQEYLEFNDQE